MLSDGFRYVDSLGRELSREEYLRSRGEGEVRIEAQEIGELECAPLGQDSALVTVVTSEVLWFRGERMEARCRAALVCVRERGGWRFVIGQTTAVEGGG